MAGMAWTRRRDDTTELPIDALALLVLQDYVAVDGWNWQNWMRESEQAGTARDPEIGLALSEAWSWLMTHGLVVRDPSQSSADAYKASRLGRETLEYGIARLAAGERLNVALHPRLAQRIQQQFLLGEFELAVFAAMKEVEVRVRELAQASPSLLGVKLMQQAFSAEKGVLTDPEADPGEQVAMMELFKADRFVQESDLPPASRLRRPDLASEVILFADLFSDCWTGRGASRRRCRRWQPRVITSEGVSSDRTAALPDPRVHGTLSGRCTHSVRQLGERSKRVDPGGCDYSGDRDATCVDVGGTSTTKLFGRECEGERRDAGYREGQDGSPDHRRIPEADVDPSAGTNSGHACDPFGGSTDRPDPDSPGAGPRRRRVRRPTSRSAGSERPPPQGAGQ